MTTVILLLGLVGQGAAVPAEAPHHRRVRCADGLDAIVIDREPSAEEAPEAEALALATAQAAILSAYAAKDDVLPVALGAAFSADMALVCHLAPAAPRIARDRAALSGAAEYVVAIDVVTSATGAAGTAPGGHLRRRQAERDARRMIDAARRMFAERVVSMLGAEAARLAEPRAAKGTTLLTVSALLLRDTAAEAVATLAALAPEAARLGLGLRMIGPCAPFSFVAPERALG